MFNESIIEIYIRVVISVFLLVGISSVAEAKPVVYFSDITDAPITGWEGSATKGAAVTLWGNNFGTSRGSSYVTCGGVNLTSDTDYGEWAATTNPTTARGLQRITFWLNSSMSTGSTTISITTTDGTSNTVPFYCRLLGTNHIYFVATDGSDSNNGLTLDTPKQTAGWVRANLIAGDVAYFRGGTWSAKDNIGSFAYGIMTFAKVGGVLQFHNGTPNNSISVTSYPGEVASFDSTGSNALCCINFPYGGGAWEYWTFSKLNMVGELSCVEIKPDTQAADPAHSTSHLRFIGNDATTVYYDVGGYGVGYSFEAGWDRTEELYIYGNYIHDLAVDYRGGPYRSGARIYPIYLGGYGSYGNVYVGWNEFGWVSCGRGFQAFGHLVTDKLEVLYFHDNYLHDTSRQSAVIGGGDGATEYSFIGTAYIYNNIMMNSEGDVCLTINGDLAGGNGGYYYIYNNVFYSPNAVANIYTGPTDTSVFKNNIFVTQDNAYNYFQYHDTGIDNCTGDHNIYYGCGDDAKPSWDSSTLGNDNPQFVVSDPNSYAHVKLISTSPGIDSGTSSGAGLTQKVYQDFMSNPRPQSSNYDVGAFEYMDGSYSPPPDVDVAPPELPTRVNVIIIQ